MNNAGLAVGEWQKWHPNGQLAEWRTFDSQGQPLARKRWDEDGDLTEDKTFAVISGVDTATFVVIDKPSERVVSTGGEPQEDPRPRKPVRNGSESPTGPRAQRQPDKISGV